MSEHYHALVWIDHHEARIYEFNASEVARATVHSSHPHQHIQIRREHPDVGKRISGVETLDHPSDGELVALARRFFRADDRMHPQLHR